ncbi:hypothetical protein G7Z17_g659 [Cylindrodendrum hubeiense]|uniref:Aminoglycoside phosphotransferase domain-containing protein n=1 Tax=Cylindrodendrum hubeiense TaxID=595255 RepID=A0A9P5HHC8_9HYPO|nr:hypothetical protein G7Z17_g659 [Cylindrodendrum hubeiense]
MAAVSHNHAKYQARLDYIQQLLVDHLDLSSEDAEQTKITPIQYDPECPFKYNNFVYRISPPTSTLAELGSANQGPTLKRPGCVPIPTGTTEFILRLSNPDAEGIYQETRVQNEVGMLTIASAALRHITPPVVPRVFGWNGASPDHHGWIMQELMPGTPLLDDFAENMSLDQKKGILTQMATLLKALQDYPLPATIEGWGGVTFDDSGAIVSAPMCTVGDGPWSSLEDSFRGRLKVKLAKADENPYLQGWRANGVRERIDAFIEHGLPAQSSDLTSKQDRAIVHADFSEFIPSTSLSPLNPSEPVADTQLATDNLLYDPKTGRITALLDYDFASILHPAYEFFRSFSSNGGQFLGWSGDTTPQDQEAAALRKAKLTGQFPSPLPAPVPSENGPAVDWELAQAWEHELRNLDVKRPSTIQGIDRVADVDEVLGSLLPWRLTNEDFLSMNPDKDETMAFRRVAEKQLVSLLDHAGF